MGAATNYLHQVLIVVLAYSDAPHVAFLWNIEGGLMYVPLRLTIKPLWVGYAI